MHTIFSSHDPRTVDEEYALAVETLLDQDDIWEQASRDRTERGETLCCLRLISYEAPGSEDERWAVFYEDNSSRELHEYDTYAQADSAYDELESMLSDAQVFADAS
ncbi:hypothetical protein ACFWXK_10790 [Streptomyces sp. NPDC059070]|uniref:hypothetical protein n=1 Tax=Streptomyces sp. NPDC059070 TaxID=3346713 RepID=UPI0036D06209